MSLFLLCSLLSVLMETSNGAVAPATPPGLDTERNHTQRHHQSHSQPHNHHDGILSFNSIIIIFFSIISVIVLFSVLLAIVMFRRLKSRKEHCSFKDNARMNSGNGSTYIAHTTINFNSSPDMKSGCLYGGHLRRAPPSRYRGVQVFTFKELEAATEKFSEVNVIGNGRFGVVYKGVLSDGTVVAVKRLHREGKQGELAFRMEVDLLSRLNSPYLVALLGYCADQRHRLLISEFMPNGTLQQHLHPFSNQYQPLDWGTRLLIALDCARALEGLHEQADPSIIHRDFKCSNILLDENFRAKVTDFGLAKVVPDKINGQISTRVLGTTGYLAPEYASTGKLTTKSDVYSYGVVLLELLTGRVPVDSNRPPGEHVLVSWALPGLTRREKVVEMVDPSLKGNFSKKDLVQVAAIVAMCVQTEADYRPLMTDVVQSLIPIVKNNSSMISPGSSRFQHQTPSPRY